MNESKEISKTKMAEAANRLLYSFENELFVNDFVYPYRLALVLAFDDYVKGLNDWELSDLLNTEDEDFVSAFREMINQGVSAWLDSCELKTLMM